MRPLWANNGHSQVQPIEAMTAHRMDRAMLQIQVSGSLSEDSLSSRLQLLAPVQKSGLPSEFAPIKQTVAMGK